MDNYKTVLCNKWQFTGSCPYGHKCMFAHGWDDIRVPSNVCKAWVESGVCMYGLKCAFAHPKTLLLK